MSERLFKISISTPEKAIFEGEISSLVAPGEMGYFGILVDHAPLIANLAPGKIIIKGPADSQKVFDCTSKGVLEVLENNVSILIDSVKKPAS